MIRPNYQGYIFQYTIKGNGYFQFEHQEYTLKEGEAFFVKVPSQSQYGYRVSGVEPWCFFYIHMDGLGVEEFYEHFYKMKQPVCNVTRGGLTVRAFMEFHKQLCSGKTLRNYEGSEFVSRFFHLFFQEMDRKMTQQSNYVERSIYLMSSYMHRSDIMQLIIHEIGISPEHFSRIFKDEMGIAPIQYVSKLRIEKAMQLLLNTNYKIEKIAVQCGFSCGNYFAKVFKVLVGISPSQYRRLH